MKMLSIIWSENVRCQTAIICSDKCTTTHTHTHTHSRTHTHTLSFYATQKKTLEINPRHPLIKELQRRVDAEEQDETTSDLARVLYETAVLRSGFTLSDSGDFALRIERMMRLSLGVDLSAEVEREEFTEEEEEEEEEEVDDDEGKPLLFGVLYLIEHDGYNYMAHITLSHTSIKYST